MKVLSTNIATPRIIFWKGREEKTGIYKLPVENPIYLEKEDVRNDHVVDRKYHGGVDKACYLYSADHYPYWKTKYPDLEWDYGMFGENITIEGFDEENIKIGSVYKLGGATIQVSRPRQPCYKLGIRFGNHAILRQMIDSLFSGVYVRIIDPGPVSVGDELQLIKENDNGISISELNTLLFHYDENTHLELAKKALRDTLVSDSDKKYFRKKIKAY
ncbi:MOSC domain-containing protein YiiM [Aquimarina sp. MAR_2010_214]|uniref:MOSC domain-containing protein n=1 Tax=Aquimarina sp. MAR_2010_214 TaxID=1250026 RepID=UPI000C703E2F|nr:MOSC domain-containing protein [Aquimarina sp. MAR_2010_214]PKV51019.1 MOSC domain-containing protein YiiM [Aquimarina sp. MAR_2010_214]